jgi:hypothetical protein
MIPAKIFSAVALSAAIFLSSVAATKLPSHPEECYKCPQKVIVRVDGTDVPFDLVSEDQSEVALEC